MENDVIQRIKQVLYSNNVSITALSKKLGIVQQTLNRQISGNGAMPLSTIDKFLSCYPDISAEWLLRGEGNMLKSFTSSHAPSSTNELTIYIDENGFLKAK